ncbi:alpha/beta hydrolase [Austwickia chelonae]|uniref:alpha/beta hydrolase n=1 Tax=Austwickia chelonae TaxID=100225 RepID=UPI000E2209B8|nr:alpha/beta hydrolase [Austwickia chelonae]
MSRSPASSTSRTRRVAKALAAVTALTLTAAGCVPASFLPGMMDGDASTPEHKRPLAPPPGYEKLAKFYSQSLSWEKCDDHECTWIEVPLDHDKPDGETLKLRARKAPATGKASRTLFVNPGGPGGSAVDLAKDAKYAVTSPIREIYDVVGVDPRGVGQSNPLICVGDDDLDFMHGSDPTPDSSSEKTVADAIPGLFGESCQRKNPQLFRHISTLDVAKDMDIARAVMGEKQMDYLGFSYGTFLGSIYADLFPKYVGRFILDGAVPPDLTTKELALGQTQGFEKATKAYLAHCVAQADCPFGTSPSASYSMLRQFIYKVEAQPLPVEGDPRVKKLTEGWATVAIMASLYSKDSWDPLTEAAHKADKGDGTELFRIAADSLERQDGRYLNNSSQALRAVDCLDRPTPKLLPSEQASQSLEFTTSSPLWGLMMADTSFCANWPAAPKLQPRRVTASGSNPIVVIGTTRDPATPYEWSERLADQLEQSRHIRHDGDGHTVYPSRSQCVDAAVDDYLLNGKAPEKRRTDC